MILAFDTYYFQQKAKTAAIIFQHWNDQLPSSIHSDIIDSVNPYEPGNFYKRELPCILKLMRQISLKNINFIIVDGYVLLDGNGKLGLGGYLYQTLENKTPVIGVAKNKFNSKSMAALAIFRGKSQKPLYISAIGISVKKAAKMIKEMHGNYRIPTLLKLLDQKTRNI